MSQFYMSFVDNHRPAGDQFVGALLLEADSLEEAITASWLLELNPGGEIAAVEIPAAVGRIPDSFMNRLLTKAEAEALPAPEIA